jgi:hypothetical protein
MGDGQISKKPPCHDLPKMSLILARFISLDSIFKIVFMCSKQQSNSLTAVRFPMKITFSRSFLSFGRLANLCLKK